MFLWGRDGGVAYGSLALEEEATQPALAAQPSPPNRTSCQHPSIRSSYPAHLRASPPAQSPCVPSSPIRASSSPIPGLPHSGPSVPSPTPNSQNLAISTHPSPTQCAGPHPTPQSPPFLARSANLC